MISVICVEETFSPYSAVTNADNITGKLGTVERCILRKRKNMVLICVVKSEQVLSMILISSFNVVVFIDVHELFWSNDVILIKVVFPGGNQCVFCAFFSLMSMALLAVKFSELFQR